MPVGSKISLRFGRSPRQIANKVRLRARGFSVCKEVLLYIRSLFVLLCMLKATDVEADLAAGIFHRKEVPISDVKKHLQEEGIEIR